MLNKLKNKKVNVYLREISFQILEPHYKVITILISYLFPVMLPSLPYKIHPKISKDCFIDDCIHQLA